MTVNGLNAPYSALRANQTRMDVAANNVANVNTEGFRAATVTTADNAYINDIGTGTRVTGTYAPPRPGPAAPAPEATGASGATAGMVETSNTDMVVEMSNMMSARNAYGANAAMARTADEASQTLMDIRQ